MDGKHTKSETQRKEVKVVRGHAMKAYGGIEACLNSLYRAECSSALALGTWTDITVPTRVLNVHTAKQNVQHTNSR